jgi:hypothetical protein
MFFARHLITLLIEFSILSILEKIKNISLISRETYKNILRIFEGNDTKKNPIKLKFKPFQVA